MVRNRVRRTTATRTTGTIASALACGLLLVACGGGGGGGGSAAGRSSSTTPATSGGAPTSVGSSPVAQPTCGSPTGSAADKGPEVNPPGDIPDNQAFVPYTPPAGSYTINVPEGWSRAEDGRSVTFTDKLNAIRVELSQSPSAPTVATAQAQEVPGIRSSARCFEGGQVTSVTRPAGPAILVTYRADAAPDPVTGKAVHDDIERYELWRNGTLAVITLTAPKGSDNVDPWRKVTDSFTWKP
jgi:hypothetical protein